MMLLTITLILAAMLALSALELLLFWRLDKRDDRRGTHRRRDGAVSRARTWAIAIASRRRGSSPVKPTA